MLQKKIERSAAFLKEHHDLFRCPICHQLFQTCEDFSFRCPAGHQFDLAKKGTLYFLDHANPTEYNEEMFAARRTMIQAGMYQPLIAQMSKILKCKEETVCVDVGCGEGSFLAQLQQDLGIYIGFDISKPAIQLASQYDQKIFWCVADLTNLPFADQSVDYLFNMLTPSHYQEFKRVLKPEGKLIKIVPESNYLKELRELYFPDEEAKQHYSNQQVIKKIKQEMTIVNEERITYHFDVSEKIHASLLKMSPLVWNVKEEVKKAAEKATLSSITVDLRLIVAQI